jgi:dipeptidyl aminopeptidase/acylaminoacyl peptidase
MLVRVREIAMPTKAFLVLVACTLAPSACQSQVAQHSDSMARAFSTRSEQSAQVCVRPAGDPSCHRLMSRTSAWQDAAVISPDGRLVAYSVSDEPLTRSEIWVSQLNGSNAHRVSGPDEDALMPAFGADTHTLLYLTSASFGHSSPIAASRRHKFDVERVTLNDSGAANGPPTQLTKQELYDVSSLAVSPDGKDFLLTVYRYPIGAVIEEYAIAAPEKIRMTYQPHVPGEPSMGPQFGQAAFLSDGLEIVFTAATEGGMYDYNVYEMSGVTGGTLVALTHGKGMLESLTVDRDDAIFFVRDGHHFKLDPKTHAMSEERL